MKRITRIILWAAPVCLMAFTAIEPEIDAGPVKLVAPWATGILLLSGVSMIISALIIFLHNYFSASGISERKTLAKNLIFFGVVHLIFAILTFGIRGYIPPAPM